MTTENKNNASSNADVEASAASTTSNKEPVVETVSMTA